jgi:hypothetical protein
VISRRIARVLVAAPVARAVAGEEDAHELVLAQLVGALEVGDRLLRLPHLDVRVHGQETSAEARMPRTTPRSPGEGALVGERLSIASSRSTARSFRPRPSPGRPSLIQVEPIVISISGLDEEEALELAALLEASAHLRRARASSFPSSRSARERAIARSDGAPFEQRRLVARGHTLADVLVVGGSR